MTFSLYAHKHEYLNDESGLELAESSSVSKGAQRCYNPDPRKSSLEPMVWTVRARPYVMYAYLFYQVWMDSKQQIHLFMKGA